VTPVPQARDWHFELKALLACLTAASTKGFCEFFSILFGLRPPHSAVSRPSLKGLCLIILYRSLHSLVV
jgi:hypothetical protein